MLKDYIRSATGASKPQSGLHQRDTLSGGLPIIKTRRAQYIVSVKPAWSKTTRRTWRLVNMKLEIAIFRWLIPKLHENPSIRF